jgi:parallel beta-helix repeat protein
MNPDYGIYLSYSSYNKLYTNKFIKNGINIDGDIPPQYNTHSIDESNKVNGKPVRYLKNQTSGKVPIGAGQVIIANCSRIVIENQDVAECSIGISVTRSSYCILRNNSCSWNSHYGIYLTYFSDNNTISDNNCLSNSDSGIYLDDSNCNILSKNQMNDDGIYMRGYSLSHWNTHSIPTSNTVNGKPVYYWKNQTSGTVPSGAGQVILANCVNIKVENQNVSNGCYGIELGFSSLCTISNNTVNSNNKNGIDLYYSHNNILSYNVVNSNNGSGISIWGNFNALSNNNVCSNGERGVAVWGDYNTISYNNASSNVVGIWFFVSNRNIISNNTVSLNEDYGIYLIQSSSNKITYNCISSNSNYGIEINASAACNHIHHNNFIGNNPGGKQAYDINYGNFWNTSGSPHGYGNYWSDWSSPDNNTDGIVDFKYYPDGGKGANDSFPLTTPVKDAGAKIPESPPPALALVLLIIMPIVVAGRRRK